MKVNFLALSQMPYEIDIKEYLLMRS
jgi:hypothetical protein